jgi:hypothetical protein
VLAAEAIAQIPRETGRTAELAQPAGRREIDLRADDDLTSLTMLHRSHGRFTWDQIQNNSH